VMTDWRRPFQKIRIGTGRKIADGREIAILSFGHPGNFVTEARRQLLTDGIEPAHYDLRFVKPLDEKLLHEVFRRFDRIITVEDGSIAGGFGSAILEFMAAHQYQAQVRILGIPDRVIEHGKPSELQRECGFDAVGIAETARALLRDRITVRS